MISGYECYRLYVPLKLHFTTPQFNVFNTPKVRGTTPTAYEKRRDKNLFERISNKFKTPQECVRYYAANFAYGHTNFLYEPGLGSDNYTLFLKRRQSITNIFSDDLSKILSLVENNKIKITENNTELFKLYINNIITHETLVIINTLNNIVDKWNNTDLAMIYENELIRLSKSDRFIKFDKNKVSSIYDEYLAELIIVSNN